MDALAGTPLAPRSGQLAEAFSSGESMAAFGSIPPDQRGALAQAAESSFVSGLDTIMLVAAIVCFVGAALSVALVRQRDAVQQPGEAAMAAAA